MSSWIKENKASIIAGGIGVVLVAGIAAVGISKNSEAEILQQKIRSAEGSIQSMARDAMPPTEEVLKQSLEILKDYKESMSSIEALYAPFRKNCVLENIDAQSFQNDLKKMTADWKNACAAKNIIVTPEAQYMGFNAYMASAPPSTAAPMLNFERLGMNYFLTKLAESGVSKFMRVYRAPLAIEAVGADTKAKSNARPEVSARPRGGKKASSELWQPLTFEVAFMGDRQSVATFLNDITTNDQYLFTISALRVKNEIQTPPSYEKPKTASAAASAVKPSSPGISLAGGVGTGEVKRDVRPADSNEEDDAPKSVEILRQVLGNEKVNVHLVVSLIYFPEQPETATKNK